MPAPEEGEEHVRLTRDIALVGGGNNGFDISAPLDCHVYLLDGGDELALVDAGVGDVPGDPDAILANAEADGFDPGRIHQPPPVHQTFEGPNFVVCSFVPRKFDYHPQAIPAPYHHSNIDSEEVMYYVSGNFMSRRGVEVGSITLHPRGIPHGPHPGAAEASIGKEGTEELAVMMDTFRPLKLTTAARDYDDERYPFSWLEHPGDCKVSDSMG